MAKKSTRTVDETKLTVADLRRKIKMGMEPLKKEIAQIKRGIAQGKWGYHTSGIQNYYNALDPFDVDLDSLNALVKKYCK